MSDTIRIGADPQGKAIRCQGIPVYTPTFEEISTQMRINADIIMKEISDHVDAELKRFKEGITIPDRLKPPIHSA